MNKILTRIACLLLMLLIPQQGIAGKIIYVHTDLLGSPIAETDQNGNVLWRKPPIPAAITVPVGIDKDGAYTVHWVASIAATSYQLIESINGGNWSAPVSLNTTSKLYTSKGNGTYRYGVKACNSVGCSNYQYSTTFTVLLKPSTPSTITVPVGTDTDGTYAVHWGASSTATNYQLIQSFNGGSWSAPSSLNTLNKSYASKGNGTYRYGIRACNNSGCSNYKYSTTFTVLLKPPAPSTITVPVGTDTDGAYAVHWGASSTATSYQLIQSFNGGSWSAPSNHSTTNKSYASKGNGTYRYGIRACNSSGCSSYRYSTIFTVLLKPSSPASITVPASDYDGSYTVSWSTASTATRYELLERVNSGSWRTLSNNATSASFNRSGLASGTYQYAVRACNATGCSAYSYSRVLTNVLMPSGVAVPSIDVDGNYTISWGGVSTRSRYVVQEKAGSGGWATLSSTTTSTSIARSGRANNTYQYRVAACNSGGCSSYRNSAIVTVTKSPISITYASKDHDGAFSVRWAGVSTASSYQLQQQAGSGSWSTIYTGNATSTSLSGRADGNYKYRVRACKGSTCSGYRTGNYIRVIRPNLYLNWDKNYVESIGLNGRIRWTANGADYCKMSYSDPYIPVAPNQSSSGWDEVNIVRNTTATMTCYFGGLSITRTSFIYVKNTNIIFEF